MTSPRTVKPTRFTTTTGATALLVAAAIAGAGLFSSPRGLRASGATPLPGDTATVRHVLNRLTFGPRPNDIETVKAMGLGAYLEQQLHPDTIADRDLDQRLAAFTTLTMRSSEIARSFAQPLFDARRTRKAEASASEPPSRSPDGQTAPGGQAGPGGNDTSDDPPKIDPAVARAAALPLLELGQQKVLRAVYSDRQLEAVLTDFWFNHFNVDARKSLDRFFLTEYEREAIRPHVLGRFRDLLGATAKSPAMLFYLDNWLSADPAGPHADAAGAGRFTRRDTRRQRFVQRRLQNDDQRTRLAGVMPKKNGLNENYARELMELHTLGVDGGYTQKDVTEVARAFTGWTIERPRQGGGAFTFDPRLHDPGDKVVLGHRIKGGNRKGVEDGEAVLDLLARHPATAHFIATKLARRFVSDEPPAALVDRLAARFRNTDGDLREVMRTLLTAPEFLSPTIVNAKTKTPFEFVVSAIRAVNGDLVDARPVVQQIAGLGMPLYQCQPPTGYKDSAEAWTNAGALVQRMNVAQLIAQGSRQSGLAAPAASLDRTVLGDLSDATAAVVAKATTDWQRVALTLGSPEFQKR